MRPVLLDLQNHECGGQHGGWRCHSGYHIGSRVLLVVPWRDSVGTQGQVAFLGDASPGGCRMWSVGMFHHCLLSRELGRLASGLNLMCSEKGTSGRTALFLPSSTCRRCEKLPHLLPDRVIYEGVSECNGLPRIGIECHPFARDRVVSVNE